MLCPDLCDSMRQSLVANERPASRTHKPIREAGLDRPTPESIQAAEASGRGISLSSLAAVLCGDATGTSLSTELLLVATTCHANSQTEAE